MSYQPPIGPWNGAKAKVQIRLAIQRLRTSQEKKNAQAKSARRDIAMLVEKGKLETARIKVESIIHDDIYVELLELLELYCELLLARFGLLDQNTRECDPGISEGVCSIINAAPRTDIKELKVLQEMLKQKFGRDFSTAALENRDNCVSERVVKKLVISTPSPALVDAYLGEIAKGYGIDWSPPEPEPPKYESAAPAESSTSGGGGGESESTTGTNTTTPQDRNGDEGGAKDAEKSAKAGEGTPKAPVDAATISAEARSSGARTPKLPDIPPEETSEATPATKPSSKETAKPQPPEDDFDMLAKRFEALKKR